MNTFKDLIDKLAPEASKRNITLPDAAVPLDEMDAAELVEARQAFKKLSRSLIGEMTDDATEKQTRSIERVHNLSMAAFDMVRDEEELRHARANDTKRPRGEDGVYPADGTSDYPYGQRSSGWATDRGDEIRVLGPKDAFATRSINGGPGLGQCLRAMVVGPRNDAERRALAEGTDSAGGFTVPSPLAREFIDRLRARAVVFAAGARTVAMDSETLAIARLETDPTASWRNENAAVTESDPTFGRVLLTARSLMGLVRVSRELIEDSVNVQEALENAFIQAFAVEFDRACLFGSGTAPEPLGLANTAGIGGVSMGTNGAALTNYDDVIDAIYTMQAANAGDPTAMIYHPRTGAALAKLKDTQNNPLRVPEMVAKVPRLTTTAVPIDDTQGSAIDASSILLGDFRDMLVGLRSIVRIEVLKERYADAFQYGFLCHMRGDVQLARKASFVKLDGIIPSA